MRLVGASVVVILWNTPYQSVKSTCSPRPSQSPSSLRSSAQPSERRSKALRRSKKARGRGLPGEPSRWSIFLPSSRVASPRAAARGHGSGKGGLLCVFWRLTVPTTGSRPSVADVLPCRPRPRRASEASGFVYVSDLSGNHNLFSSSISAMRFMNQTTCSFFVQWKQM
jgi:hypothetical protein